jgi:hypothetical protein
MREPDRVGYVGEDKIAAMAEAVVAVVVREDSRG